MTTGASNWAGNYSYQAKAIHEPSTLAEVQALVARRERIHAIGSRHCFNDIADGVELVSLDRFDAAITIDRDAKTVTTGAAVRYGTLARTLDHAGFALHAMASLPHISVIGAVATATHGSGDTSGNLATAVSALELVTVDGDMLQLRRGDPDFAGAVVGIGALGVVTRLTLDIEPAYQMQQQVFERLSWDTLFDHFDEVTGAGTSVSLFTDYSERVNQVWIKTRIEPDNPRSLRSEFLGAPAATRNLHPAGDAISADVCTEQLGIPGSWADRLPHFRMEAVPASGAEIQSEFMVARRDALTAIRVILAHADELRPHLWVSEIRTVAPDDLWLSSAYGRETVCLHFSFRRVPETVDRLVHLLEDLLAPFAPRPHWGKIFFADAATLRGRYERMDDFLDMAKRYDPTGKFRNHFLDRHLYGNA